MSVTSIPRSPVLERVENISLNPDVLPSSRLDQSVLEAVRELRSSPLDPLVFVHPESPSGLRRRVRSLLIRNEIPVSGVKFSPVRAVAREWLARAHHPVVRDTLSRRRVGLEAVFQRDLSGLEYFQPGQLVEGPGYARAIAGNIRSCERAGLTPQQLGEESSPRVRDLGRLWRRVDDLLGWPPPEVPKEASDRPIHPGMVLKTFLRLTPPPPVPDAALLAVLEDPSVLEREVLARMSDHLPVRVLRLATPIRIPGEPKLKRSGPEQFDSALAALKGRLFRTGDYLRENGEDSTQTDDSVRLEEYSVPEREFEAAVQWTLSKLEDGIAPHQIGLFLADNRARGPLFTRLREAADRIDLDTLPVHLAGGLPLAEMPRGSSLLLLVRALIHFLRQEEMIRLLPELDAAPADASVPSMTASEWRQLVYESGMVGGSRTRPGNCRRWLDDFDTRIEQLKQQVEQLEDGSGEDRRIPREAGSLRRWFEALKQHREPVKQLVDIASGISSATDQRPPLNLHEIWDRLRTFSSRYLPVQFRNLDFFDQLEEKFRDCLPEVAAREIHGPKALRLLRNFLGEVRLAHPDSESGGVYVGSLTEGNLRRFRVVRVLGLAENALPDVPRENPILPDDTRESLNRRLPGSNRQGLTLSSATSKDQLRRLYHLLHSVQEQVVFSTAREDREGTRRGFSSLYVDLVLAGNLSREAVPGDATVHSLMERGRQRQNSRAIPVRPRERVESKPGGSRVLVPGDWSDGEEGVFDLRRIHRLMERARDPRSFAGLDGGLPDDLPPELFNGLSERRPLSASAAGRFVQCPHWFMMERLLGFEEPPEPPPVSAFSPLHFGSLVHRAAEQLYEHIERVDGDEEQRRRILDEVVDEQFERMLREYTLLGEDAKQREKQRLSEFMENLLEIDRRRLDRDYVLEQRFEANGPDGLRMMGYLDRVESDRRGRSYIRDLKSGSAERDPDIVPSKDLQLGFYRELLRRSGEGFGEVEEVSYLYPSTPWHPERRFRRGDEEGVPLERLNERTTGWLEMISRLLTTRSFPRTEDEDDCRYCPFKPVCGKRAQQRSALKLEHTDAKWVDLFLERKRGAD